LEKEKKRTKTEKASLVCVVLCCHLSVVLQIHCFGKTSPNHKQQKKTPISLKTATNQNHHEKLVRNYKIIGDKIIVQHNKTIMHNSTLPNYPNGD
jgi:hypothetical protein